MLVAVAVLACGGVTFCAIVLLSWLVTLRLPTLALLSGLLVLGVGGVWLGLR